MSDRGDPAELSPNLLARRQELRAAAETPDPQAGKKIAVPMGGLRTLFWVGSALLMVAGLVGFWIEGRLGPQAGIILGLPFLICGLFGFPAALLRGRTLFVQHGLAARRTAQSTGLVTKAEPEREPARRGGWRERLVVSFAFDVSGETFEQQFRPSRAWRLSPLDGEQAAADPNEQEYAPGTVLKVDYDPEHPLNSQPRAYRPPSTLWVTLSLAASAVALGGGIGLLAAHLIL